MTYAIVAISSMTQILRRLLELVDRETGDLFVVGSALALDACMVLDG
jgi:hypothetical protein